MTLKSHCLQKEIKQIKKNWHTCFDTLSLIVCTALTHGSTEGHGKATILHFRSQLYLISSSLVPLHSGETRTKPISKQHNLCNKKCSINNVFCSLILELMRVKIFFHTVLKSTLTNNSVSRPLIHHIKPNYAAVSLPHSIILLDLSVLRKRLTKHVSVTTVSFPVYKNWEKHNRFLVVIWMHWQNDIWQDMVLQTTEFTNAQKWCHCE